MQSSGPILVAVDFSDDSMSALLWGAHQAALESASLMVLHVVHDPAHTPGFYRNPDDDVLRPMAERAQEMMDDFLKRARATHPEEAALSSAVVRIVPGLPAGRIAEVAAQNDARMIVVGSRGQTGLDLILLGSVAERVVKMSRAPVVVVKALSPGAGA
jgi:nucleotide-binding universal stress UspA family protein